jgi:D-alanyl-D-alanine carboxypeptidase
VLGESSGDERAIRAATLLEYGYGNYGWKELFANANLDTLPTDPAAHGLTSVRETVAAWGCHPGRRAVGAHGKRGKGKLAAKGKHAKKKGQQPADDTAAAPDAATSPAPVARPQAANKSATAE